MILVSPLSGGNHSGKAMGPLDRGKVFPCSREMGSEPFELFEVKGGEDF